MAEPQIPPPEPAAPPPLTATLAQIAGSPDFSLVKLRQGRADGLPAMAGDPPPKAVEPPKEPEKTDAGTGDSAESHGLDAAAQSKEAPKSDVSEAAKTLAQHKSTRAKEIAEEIRLLTKDKHEHRREIEALKTESAQLRAAIAVLKGDKQDRPDTARAATVSQKEHERLMALPGAPHEEEFERYTDFIYAAQVFVTKTLQQEHDDQIARTQSTRSREEARRAFKAKLPDARKKYADWDEVTAVEVPMSDEVEWAILNSSRDIEIARYLHSHPAEAEAFAALRGDPRAIRWMLELRLSAAPSGSTETAKPVTKAQDPPKPVGAAPTASLPSLESAVAGTEISLKRIRQIKDARGGR